VRLLRAFLIASAVPRGLRTFRRQNVSGVPLSETAKPHRQRRNLNRDQSV